VGAARDIAFAIGVVAGPILLTWIAFLDHVRQHHTQAEFWTGFITVPLGTLCGGMFGVLLASYAARCEARARTRQAGCEQTWLPLTGRWLWYGLLPALFVASLLAVYVVLRLLGTRWLGPWPSGS
jgi:hypothetical protein